MVKFKEISTGLILEASDKGVIEQMRKHKEAYEEIGSKKQDKEPATKAEKKAK